MSKRFDRRSVLAGVGSGLIGVGVISELVDTGAFSSLRGSRGVNTSLADESNALVGLDVYSPVQKNSQDPLVKVTNNTGTNTTITVSLSDCTQGTLYDPQGDSGCSVTFTLLSGNSGSVDIVASETGTIPFDVDVDSSELAFQASRATEAETGNISGAVTVDKVKKFSANPSENDWSIGQVRVSDGDGDNDLDRVEYEITDSNGTVRATRTDAASGKKYQEKNINIDPDSMSYSVAPNEQYTLTVTGYDADGNFDTETKQDRA